MKYKWKPSKEQAKDFKDTMKKINQFCLENNIQQSLSSDSYYFIVNGIPYRISNHTVAASDKGCYDDIGNKIRESYHNNDPENMVYITASKTRIIEIYNDIVAGYKLNKRGYRI